ncbi:MAG: hypothetical protein IKW49_04050 [Opitutales bacterium]|nr:hypothetical protein [Opitutales bacterium]
MKKILFVLFAVASVILFAGSREKELAKKLYGRIRVEHDHSQGSDYRVRVVESGEDLRVRIVDAGADSPGQWQIVDEETPYDFSIRYRGPEDIGVSADIEVRFVKHGEGPSMD